eukprot:CAMPEP_0172679928 /NCGR_PEP_ID=MMETSP1074-20121228/16404_1 /TAXON_ID=2916 /ORGANISM="Ceratium fusus, Strain PA161109" /LENGTH=297 /DNA_ID=CAMNT_0013498171 /DNA_START=71 /DNA_END=960 /DNA_ORIENTATION=-
MDYGSLAIPQTGKGKPLLRFQRRRMNAAAIMLNLFMPWALFCITFAASALTVRYESPRTYAFVVGCTFVFALAPCAMAIRVRLNRHADLEYEPTWHIFLAFSMITAWFAGFLLGDITYTQYTRPYCDMMNLNTYVDVSPAGWRGQQVMDAGTIQFATGSRLDITKSMGFKNKEMYCVAPITIGNGSLPTYDFWVVGTDCCSGGQADFHCPSWNSRKALGGLRLLTDATRPFYRLAVQQAESAHGIKAAHPVFFTWVHDPMAMVEGWRQGAQQAFLFWMFVHLLTQIFLVVAASLVYA